MLYTPRVVDDELRSRLAAMGAVVIEGPKFCGKTVTARQVAKSEVLLDLDLDARQAAAVDPTLILDGPTPRLFDEWQVEPGIWNAVRRAVDDTEDVGRFILTGSAVPPDDETRHTGSGRFARLRMRPMSLFETGHSNATVSLEALLDGQSSRCPDPGLSIDDLAARITVGGWPALQGLQVNDARRAVRDYLDGITRTDISRVDGKARDPGNVRRLLASLSRNIATHVSARTLAADVSGSDGPMKYETVLDYLDALTRLMIVEDQPAWAAHLRSKARVRSAPKRHFVDPSLAVAAMAATPSRIAKDLNLLGFLFESLVVRDLRIYAQHSDAQVLQYRDAYEVEVDAIVEAADGRWAAFEVKLGGKLIDDGAETLKRFARAIDTAKCGEPAVLGVITGSGYGYVRDDGIAVIPIASLAP